MASTLLMCGSDTVKSTVRTTRKKGFHLLSLNGGSRGNFSANADGSNEPLDASHDHAVFGVPRTDDAVPQRFRPDQVSVPTRRNA